MRSKIALPLLLSLWHHCSCISSFQKEKLGPTLSKPVQDFGTVLHNGSNGFRCKPRTVLSSDLYCKSTHCSNQVAVQRVPSTSSTQLICIVGAEGMKQLHCSSCIKIQARLVLQMFLVVRREMLCVFWEVWGSCTYVTLDLGWCYFLLSCCVCTQACFMVLELYMACFHIVIYLSGSKDFRGGTKAQSLWQCSLCSTEAPACRRGAPMEMGHAHLSWQRWPADQQQALARSLE